MKILDLFIHFSGSLLNAALEDIIDCVLSIEEFSVDDCEYLQKVLSQIADHVVQLFQNPKDPSQNPHVLLHEHVATWFRFKELVQVRAFIELNSNVLNLIDLCMLC